MRTTRWCELLVVVVLVVVLGSTGCATLPACPAKGGPAWLELTSAHFRLRTDLDADDAQETVRRLEELRASMLATLWAGAPEPPNRTEVVVLRSRNEFMVFARDPTVPPLLWGLRSQRAPFPASLVFSGMDYRTMGVLVHELALDVSTWYVPMQPSWYSEGIATFLETLRYDRTLGKVRIGEPSSLRYLNSDSTARISAARLLAPSRTTYDVNLAHLEDSSWLLVHFLINTRPKDFGRFQKELAVKPPAVAWSIAFPDLTPDKLDDALYVYSRSGKYTWGTLALPVPAPAISQRVMTDADVHATRALLFETAMAPGVAPEATAAQREIAEALAADPSNVDALAMRSFWFMKGARLGERAELARVAATAHPDAWLSWLMVAELTTNGAETRAALLRANQLDPNEVNVLSDLAYLDAGTGNWEEALSASTMAMHLGERGWRALQLHGRALAHVGRCDAAAAFLEVLRALAPSNVVKEADDDWTSLKQTYLDVAARAARQSPPATGTVPP